MINHGVNTSLIENMKNGVEQFFNLPMEEKKKYWQTPNDMQGFGQLFVASDEQKLEWQDMFYINTLPLDSRHPHLIPSIPKPFRFSQLINLYMVIVILVTYCVTNSHNNRLMYRNLKIVPNCALY